MPPLVSRKKREQAAKRYKRLCQRELAHQPSKKELRKWAKDLKRWKLKPIGPEPIHPLLKRLKKL